MESRFCQHGNLRSACRLCKAAAVDDAEVRAARNRERGETGRQEKMEAPVLHYPWQRESFEAWREGGRAGLAALSLGLPLDDLPYAVMADMVNANTGTNVLFVCAPDQVEGVRQTLEGRFGRTVTTLEDHHYLEPRGDGVVLVADTETLPTVDLPSWGRFASNGLLVLLDADNVGPQLGQQLLESPFPARFCVSRQPSAVDLLVSRPWTRGFGPLLYRFTEIQARDLGILPRIRYRLHLEMLRPEPEAAEGPEGPWDSADVPTLLVPPKAGQFAKGRARDVAVHRAQELGALVVAHDGVPVREALLTAVLRDVPESYDKPPSGWLNADPDADARTVLRLATVAFKALREPGAVEDIAVLPVPRDLCRVPPWQEAWRSAAVQIDRVAAGLLLADEPGEALTEEDLEALVGVALALRGIPAEELYAFSPIVAEAARVAHEGSSIPPERVREVARAYGGLAASLLVGAELGPLGLLRVAHPRFTPGAPDLPHPSLYDARAHAWRGRAFAALGQAAGRGDLVTAWGRYPELRFVFPSSTLLEASTSYCRRHRLKGPVEDLSIRQVHPRSRILDGTEPDLGPTRDRALGVLREWNDALELAERQEREFLSDMHARQPERERRREGTALPGLAVVSSTGDRVTLETEGGRLPATNISPGSEVAIVEQGERKTLARGLVSRMTPRRVEVEFPHDVPPRRWPRRVTVNLVFDPKVFEAYHGAVLAAVRSIETQSVQEDSPDGLLRACLLGDVPSGKQEPQSFDVPALTESQREAVEKVLSGGRVHLVHGPPGTGKTHTLTHLATALSRAGHSVLVTADSNAAVDNMVVGLRRMGALVVRIAHAPNLRDEAAEPARVDPLDAPLFVRWAAEQGIVVATTNYGAFRYLDAKGSMSPFLFDYVVHDEAGQSTAPSSLSAVMRGRRLVLAGDPLQLPPTVVSLDAKEAGLDVTLFERMEDLTGRYRTTLLRTQFRMRDEIVAFSNRRYYEGRIDTAPSAAQQECLQEAPPLAFQHVTGRENPRQRNGSISNNYEVDCVRHLVEQFRPQAREHGWTMAVLTPYQAQREQFRRVLPDIEASTVDGAQGREWDIVFYSSVRSNPRHRLGFLEDERRLNVAVTRAKRHFVLVGDERTLRSHEGFTELLDQATKIRMFFPDRHGTDISRRGAAGRGAPQLAQPGRRGKREEPRRQPDAPSEGKKRRRRRRGRRGRGEAGGEPGAPQAQPAQEGRRRGRRGGGERPAGEAAPDAGPEPGHAVEGADAGPEPAAPAPKRGRRGKRDAERPKPSRGTGGAPAEGRPGAEKLPAKADGAKRPAKAKADGAKKRPTKAKADGAKKRPTKAEPDQEAAAAKDGAKAPKRSAKAAGATAPARPARAKKAAAGDTSGAKASGTKASGTCKATTQKGTPCRNPARPGSAYCARHGG